MENKSLTKLVKFTKKMSNTKSNLRQQLYILYKTMNKLLFINLKYLYFS